MQMRDQFNEATAKPLRKPGGMQGLIKIRPGFEEADKEIEALFYAEPIEAPPRSRGEELE
jgi:hypothetical protein